MEKTLIERQGIPFQTIPAAGLHGVNLTAIPGNLTKLTKGLFEARRILNKFKPDVLFFTGGYLAVPMAFAGRTLKSLLYVPDIEPGAALKSLAGMSDAIAVTTAESQRYFNKKVIETGYPLRQDLTQWSRPTAHQYLNLTGEKPVLLVFGGSKGARSINKAVLKSLTELLERFEIIHLTGDLDWDMVREQRDQLPKKTAALYHTMPYLHEMGAALASADLVVSRAGASCLGEFPLFGLPAVLVPYPHAWRYQKVNADHLAQRGAAILLEDHLLAFELAKVLIVLIDNPNKLQAMRAAMFEQSHPHAAEKIAGVLMELAGEKSL